MKFDSIVFRPGGLNEKYIQMMKGEGSMLKKVGVKLRNFYKSRWVFVFWRSKSFQTYQMR